IIQKLPKIRRDTVLNEPNLRWTEGDSTSTCSKSSASDPHEKTNAQIDWEKAPKHVERRFGRDRRRRNWDNCHDAVSERLELGVGASKRQEKICWRASRRTAKRERY